MDSDWAKTFLGNKKDRMIKKEPISTTNLVWAFIYTKIMCSGTAIIN